MPRQLRDDNVVDDVDDGHRAARSSRQSASKPSATKRTRVAATMTDLCMCADCLRQRPERAAAWEVQLHEVRKHLGSRRQ